MYFIWLCILFDIFGDKLLSLNQVQHHMPFAYVLEYRHIQKYTQFKSRLTLVEKSASAKYPPNFVHINYMFKVAIGECHPVIQMYYISSKKNMSPLKPFYFTVDLVELLII